MQAGPVSVVLSANKIQGTSSVLDEVVSSIESSFTAYFSIKLAVVTFKKSAAETTSSGDMKTFPTVRQHFPQAVHSKGNLETVSNHPSLRVSTSRSCRRLWSVVVSPSTSMRCARCLDRKTKVGFLLGLDATGRKA